jgi:hypothetical protein
MCGKHLSLCWLVTFDCGSRTAPIAFSSIQKSEYVHMQYYRVDEYMEIRIDRQANFRIYVYLNIQNCT